MLVGAIAHVAVTFLAARGAMMAFESKCALADSLIERYVKVETISCTMFNNRQQDLVFYTKSERRIWDDFEKLILRLSKAFSDTHGLGLRVSVEDIGYDARYLRGEISPLAQGGNLAITVNSLSTCVIHYAQMNTEWMQSPSAINTVQWLSQHMDLADKQVALNAIGLIAQVAERAPT